jgi:Family of unknown function (DUF5681)
MTMARKNKSGGRRGDQFNDVVENPYRVGDGRLPTETQFKPGISGDPKGRNKKAPRFSEVIEQVLDEKIQLRVGNRVRRQRESKEPNAQLHSTLHPEHQS